MDHTQNINPNAASSSYEQHLQIDPSLVDPTFYPNFYTEQVAGFPPQGDANPSTSISESSSGPFTCDLICDSTKKKPQEKCGKSFARRCDLTKHQNNHTRPRKCLVSGCTVVGFAETKDLHRHMLSHHPQSAREWGIENDRVPCVYCGAKFRPDNRLRHERKCKSRPADS